MDDSSRTGAYVVLELWLFCLSISAIDFINVGVCSIAFQSWYIQYRIFTVSPHSTKPSKLHVYQLVVWITGLLLILYTYTGYCILIVHCASLWSSLHFLFNVWSCFVSMRYHFSDYRTHSEVSSSLFFTFVSLSNTDETNYKMSRGSVCQVIRIMVWR